MRGTGHTRLTLHGEDYFGVVESHHDRQGCHVITLKMGDHVWHVTPLEARFIGFDLVRASEEPDGSSQE